MIAAFPHDTRPRPARTAPARTDPAPTATPLDDVITGVPGFGPRPLVTLVWDDGTRHVVRRPTIFGRIPQPVPGWEAVAVRDETLSLSRAHFAIGGEPGAVWVADTGSSNGTDLVRSAGLRGVAEPLSGVDRHRIALGERWILRAGDILEVGDRRVNVEGV